jgi:ABC-type branched-subunit amino acid transport system substrate-binding protein
MMKREDARPCRRVGARSRRRPSRPFVAPFVVALLLAGSTLANGIRIGVIVPDADSGTPLAAALAMAAEQGAIMAEEEHLFNADLFGIEFEVHMERASGAGAVTTAADRLHDEAGVLAVIGGFDAAEADALSAWALDRGLPYLNVGASADALRNERCRATTYHVEPSAGMYLDAVAGWYVRSGFRDWHFVVGDDAESQAQYERALWSLRERHFGAREAGRTDLGAEEAVDEVAAGIVEANADLVVLLVDAERQLEMLAALEAAGLGSIVAGFPYPAAQTRAFYLASRQAAPRLGSDHRASAWEATLDAYGAREINARFLQRFGEPMEPSAWATYQAVKVVFEAATLGGTATPEGVMAYMAGPQGVFDVWKGIGVTFRSWDRQLRQSLYLVNISATQEDPFAMVTLVGELPAIYMPGTDPVQRLDQLGDLREHSRCTP